MLIVVALNYCIFITLCINHVLICNKKKYVILNIPIVQDRPLYFPKFMFSSKLPLLWCWMSPCPAQVCDDSQAGTVVRTWDDASFKVRRSDLGEEKCWSGESELPEGHHPRWPDHPHTYQCTFPMSHSTSHKIAWIPTPVKEWWALSPVTPCTAFMSFQRRGRTNSEKLRGCPRSKRIHQQQRVDRKPFIIDNHHHYHLTATKHPSCRLGIALGAIYIASYTDKSPDKSRSVPSIIKLKKIGSDRSSGFPTSRKK